LALLQPRHTGEKKFSAIRIRPLSFACLYEQAIATIACASKCFLLLCENPIELEISGNPLEAMGWTK
jgi:hypothetical protein